jgi:hypothetical protein
MAWQCPYTPLELLEMNPHDLDYDSRVILPTGQIGTLDKLGFRLGQVAIDGGGRWAGPLTDLRPYREGEEPKPRIEQLSLL